MDYKPSQDQVDLHRRANAMLQRLDLPDNPELSTIVSRVATLTGKQIDVEPLGDRDWETITGLVLQTANSATVLVRKSDPRWYQFHTVLHELSHVVFGHTGCSTLPIQHPGHLHVRAGQTILARGVASPDFEKELDFTNHAAVMEAEAERLSQLLSRVVLRPRRRRDEMVFG